MLTKTKVLLAYMLIFLVAFSFSSTKERERNSKANTITDTNHDAKDPKAFASKAPSKISKISGRMK
jgi:hypothetical protein